MTKRAFIRVTSLVFLPQLAPAFVRQGALPSCFEQPRHSLCSGHEVVESAQTRPPLRADAAHHPWNLRTMGPCTPNHLRIRTCHRPLFALFADHLCTCRRLQRGRWTCSLRCRPTLRLAFVESHLGAWWPRRLSARTDHEDPPLQRKRSFLSAPLRAFPCSKHQPPSFRLGPSGHRGHAPDLPGARLHTRARWCMSFSRPCYRRCFQRLL
mmetsp:Transcript_48594/g.114005  ORF Transcript_48594/g.114005 Transcript_48594/m.114005 type:complete len:210 (-) Transcript_48594:1582-2211(-)